MKEFLDFAFLSINIVPTTLFCFILVYWILVIVGGLDVSSLDFDIDIDMDVDVEADIDIEVNLGHSVGWFNNILAFFGLGQIPLMIFLSFLVLPFWYLSLMINDQLGINSFLLSLAIQAGLFILCLFIAKFLTMPFVKLFSKIKNDTESINIVGQVCTILLATDEKSIGQAEIKENGSSVKVNVRCAKGVELKKGEKGLIIDLIENQNIYLIEPYN